MEIWLSRVDKEPQRFEGDLELAPERLAVPEVVEPVQVHLAGTVARRGGRVVVRGDLAAHGRLICSRCLEQVAWSGDEGFEVEVRQLAEGAGGAEGEPEDDDALLVDGEVLDLAEVAVQQVLLALPMKVLCDEDCRGLCPSCGANRNRDDACRCEPEAADPRWSALRDLKDRSS